MWLRSKVGISLPSSLPSKSVSGDLLESKSQFLSWSERGEDSVLLISPACFFPHPNRGRGRTCPGWPEHQRAHLHYANPETEPQMDCTPLPHHSQSRGSDHMSLLLLEMAIERDERANATFLSLKEGEGL